MPIRIAYYLPRMEQIGNRSQLQLLRQQLPADDFQSRLFGFVASRQQASQSDADECLIYRSHAVDPVALLRLAKALKAWRADIVHVWGPEDLGVEVRWPLKRAASLRMATLHNPPARGGRWIPAAAQRWLASCQQVTGTSHSVLKQLPAAIEGEWLPALVAEKDRDPERRLRSQVDLPPASRYLLVAGSDDRLEQLELVLQVMELLVTVHDDLQLVILGPMALADWIPRRVEQFELTGRVHLASESCDWQDLLAAASLVLQPSSSQGISTTLLHAMSAALPVVVADLPPHRELLSDDAAEFFPTGDSGQCARQVHQLLGDPARMKQLGAAARTAFESRDSLSQLVGRFEHIYSRLVAHSRSAGGRE